MAIDNFPERPVQRRPRGSMQRPVPLGLLVEGDAKDRFDLIARRSGLTGAVFFEQMMLHLELTDQGIPSWVPPLSRDGELPIDVP